MKVREILIKNLKIIKIVSLIFIFMVIIGLSFPNFQSDIQEEIKSSIISKIQGKGYFGISFFIIFNNIVSSLLSIIFGVIFMPVYSLLLNGYFIGAVLSGTANPLISVLTLVPHGIFEIPAIIIAFSLGIRIGLCWIMGNKIQNFKQSYIEGIYVFILLIIPLLCIAGLIEGLLFIAVS